MSWTATWPKLHNQQLPRGPETCQLVSQVGPGTILKQNFFYRDVIQNFFFTGTKFKTGPNYKDYYHI